MAAVFWLSGRQGHCLHGGGHRGAVSHPAGAAGNPVGGAGAVQPIKRGDAPWDGVMKHAPAGYVFARTITDDTMPGGPVQRTIEYAAPFDRCDREQDYETAWKCFEEKYKE